MAARSAPAPIQPDPAAEPIRPWVTWVVIAVNVLAFAWQRAQGVSWVGIDYPTGLSWGANHGPAFARGEWWRCLTSTILHSGWFHLASNMSCLVVLGPRVERLLGHVAFASLYVLSGVAAAIGAMAVTPQIVSLGASGGVFALLGAYAVYHLRRPRTRRRREIPVEFKRVALVIGISLATGVISPRISNTAHAVGLLFGVIGAWMLGRPDVVGARMTPQRWRAVALLALACLPLAWLVPLRVEATRRELPSPEALRRIVGSHGWPAVLAAAERHIDLGATVSGHTVRAIVRIESGEWESALADAEIALAEDPGMGKAAELRALALSALGRWDAALAAGRAASALEEDEGRIVTWLAQAHLGQREAGDRELAAWLASLPPDAAEPKVLRARFLAGTLDRAAFQSALQSHVREVDAEELSYLAVAERQFALGQTAEARVALEKVSRLGNGLGYVQTLARTRLEQLGP